MLEGLSLPPLPLPPEWLGRGEASLVLLPAGFLLLLFGRRLFWLLVAVVGAVAALWLATEMLGLESGLPRLVAAIAAGLVGALLAILVQKAAVALVGFLAGVWGALVFLDTLAGSSAFASATTRVEPTVLQIVLAIAGGVVGALLAARLFEAALVVLSALAGSLLLVHGLGLTTTWADRTAWVWGAFLALALFGVLVQTRGGRRRHRSDPDDDG